MLHGQYQWDLTQLGKPSPHSSLLKCNRCAARPVCTCLHARLTKPMRIMHISLAVMCSTDGQSILLEPDPTLSPQEYVLNVQR